MTKPEIGQQWSYKPTRGSGRFNVVRVHNGRVTLRDVHGMRRDKTISVKTLRGDYQEVS